MPETQAAIQKYLENCRELTQFCTQNGWIDNSSLRFEIKSQDAASALLTVQFAEVVMEGAGCIADRVQCFGQLRLFFDADGIVTGSQAE
jgi:hypothetical protein